MRRGEGEGEGRKKKPKSVTFFFKVSKDAMQTGCTRRGCPLHDTRRVRYSAQYDRQELSVLENMWISDVEECIASSITRSTRLLRSSILPPDVWRFIFLHLHAANARIGVPSGSGEVEDHLANGDRTYTCQCL